MDKLSVQFLLSEYKKKIYFPFWPQSLYTSHKYRLSVILNNYDADYRFKIKFETNNDNLNYYLQYIDYNNNQCVLKYVFEYKKPIVEKERYENILSVYLNDGGKKNLLLKSSSFTLLARKTLDNIYKLNYDGLFVLNNFGKLFDTSSCNFIDTIYNETNNNTYAPKIKCTKIVSINETKEEIIDTKITCTNDQTKTMYYNFKKLKENLMLLENLIIDSKIEWF